MKNNKIIIALALTGTFGITQAQWAVTNVNDIVFFGPAGVFTQMMGKMNMAINAGLSGIQSGQEVQLAQTNKNVAATDGRVRRAAGLLEVAKRDNEQRPTIEQCVEITKGAYKIAGLSGSLSSGRRYGGGGAKPTTPGNPSIAPPGNAIESIHSTADQAFALLKTKVTDSTCTPSQQGTAGCTGASGIFPNGDIQELSILANTKGAKINQDIANYSIDDDGWKVANAYVTTATSYNPPRAVQTATQLAKNPVYLSMYNAFRAKLDAASDSLLSIASFRKAVTLPTFAAKIWNDNKDDYSAIYSGDIPPKPSVFEVVNLNVMSDYLIGKKDAEPTTVAKRLALSNYIAWKHLQEQEHTNILLAHMLAQMITPVNKDALDAEYIKTINMK